MFKNDVINCVREHLDKWYATGNHQETAIQLVDEYEERIRADERAKTIESVIEDIIPTLCECDVDEEEIENCKRRLEQKKEVRNESY